MAYRLTMPAEQYNAVFGELALLFRYDQRMICRARAGIWEYDQWLFSLDTQELDCGCSIWIGSKSHGYGVFAVGGRKIRAHRAAWELEVGPIQHGLVIDHLCGNKACVAIHHLEPVTTQENSRRGRRPLAHAPPCRGDHH